MNVLDAIKSRRTVREFTGEEVSDEQVNEILEAGRWAPSGLNNQPWKFKVVRDADLKGRLAACTKYGRIIEAAPASIAVFFDADQGYDRTKDIQSMGACIQNMLLAAHGLGLGAVWLGEILNQKEEACKVLGVPDSLELMAVVAVGRPKGESGEGSRKSLWEVLIVNDKTLWTDVVDYIR